MEDCIFCKIVKGEIPSATIYEDEDVFAFLDVNPVTKGHSLVIPKKHFENIFDIDKQVLQKVTAATKQIAERVKKSLRADGIRLSQSNGKTAGQAVLHFHLHVIPRYENDGLGTDMTETSHPPKADFEFLKKLAQQINS